MTASSVTGRGLGSADGKNKGSSHMTLGVGHLIGPRIMIADSVTLDSSGDATVVLPLLSGAVGDYIVTATENGVAAAAAVAVSIAFNANDTTLVFKGPVSTLISYTVVKKGMAL